MFNILSNQAGLILLSRFIERFAYYFVRCLIVVAAVSKLNVPQEEIFEWYFYFVIGDYVAQFIAGILGDILKNRRTLNLIGTGLQIIGVSLLLTKSDLSYFVGAFAFTIGTGFYSNTSVTSFGILFREKPDKQNHVWMLFFLAVSLSSSLGIISGVYIAELKSNIYDLFLAGSLLFIVLSGVINYKALPSTDAVKTISHKKSGALGFIVITIIILASLLYWTSYELLSGWMNTLANDVQNDFSKGRLISVSTNIVAGITILSLGIITKLHFLRWISLAFIFMALGSLAFYIPVTTTVNDWNSLITIYILFSIGEVLLVPIAFATYFRFTNPRLIGTVIGAAALTSGLVNRYLVPKIIPFYNSLTFPQQFNLIASIAVITAILIFISSYMIKDKSPFYKGNETNKNTGLKEEEILD